ncbi:ABC transporter permease [Corynebacterium sp. S7]
MSATETTQKHNQRKAPPPAAQAIGLIILVPIIIGLMLFAFLAPSQASGPKDVPIAVSAPEPVVTQIQERLGADPDNAPELIEASSANDVEQLILNREAVGGMAVAPEGATVYTASGNGAVYTQMLTGIADTFRSSGQTVNIVDLAPTSADDPNATGIATLGLPLAFGGLVSAVAVTFLMRGRKWLKTATLIGIAAVGGLVVTWLLHTVYGTLTGSFWLEFLAIALGIAATSLSAAGLAAVLGFSGLGLAAIATIFIANPLSGLATGPWLLPAGWSTLGQWMTIGATGHLVRSISFFDGAGVGSAWWVLIIWAVAGLLLLAVDRSKPKAVVAN